MLVLHQNSVMAGFPFGRAAMNKTSQKSFHTLIHPLCLTISLGVIGGSRAHGGAGQFKQILLKGAELDGVPIRNNGERHTM